MGDVMEQAERLYQYTSYAAEHRRHELKGLTGPTGTGPWLSLVVPDVVAGDALVLEP